MPRTSLPPNVTPIFQLLCLLLAASPCLIVANAQSRTPKVNYGSGDVGAFRQRLSTLMDSASDISNKIAAIGIAARYCNPEARKEDGDRLKAARAEFNALAASYTAFKGSINSTAARLDILTQFNAAGYDVSAPNFWTPFDQDVINHTRADLIAAEKVFAASTVVDCTEKKTAAPPPSPPSPAPRRNPLAGFTRPTIPQMPPAPEGRAAFCTEAERAEYVKKVIQPMMDANKAVTDGLSKYTNSLWDEIGKPRASDTVAAKAQSDEMRWGNTEHLRWDKRWFELQRLRDGLTVIDCTQPRTVERRASPEVDTLKLGKFEPPRVGLAPFPQFRLGTGVEYAYYPKFEPVVGEQTYITSTKATPNTKGFGIDLGIDFNKKFGCGLSAHYGSSQTYTQIYSPPKLNFAMRSMGEVHNSSYECTCGPRWELPGTRWVTYLYLGGGLVIDKLEYVDEFGGGKLFSGERSLHTWKTNFGAGVAYPIDDRFDVRLDVRQTIGKFSGDADMNTRFSVGAQYHPNIRF